MTTYQEIRDRILTIDQLPAATVSERARIKNYRRLEEALQRRYPTELLPHFVAERYWDNGESADRIADLLSGIRWNLDPQERDVSGHYVTVMLGVFRIPKREGGRKRKALAAA